MEPGMEQTGGDEPRLCATGCGFFANLGTGGMCSKCYREHQAELEKEAKAADALRAAASAASIDQQQQQQQQQQPAAEAAVAVEEAPAPAPQQPQPAAPAVPAAPSTSSPPPGAAAEPPAKTPTRCQTCRKKVGLTGFKCRCGQLFCGQHRYAEAHDCTFDYKSVERAKLAEANPLVQASKVERF